MRPSRRHVFAVGACAVVLLLTGCVGADPDVPAPPQPTATPVFASEEEALAAATEAYAAYLEMSDLIAQEGGANPERLAPYVTEEWLDVEIKPFEDLAVTGGRQVGSTSFDSMQLQQVDISGAATDLIAYACLDVGDAVLVDSQGTVVTPNREAERWPFEISFQGDPNELGKLVVGGHEQWVGSDFCL